MRATGEAVGLAIKARRIAVGKSQRDLAHAAGVKVNTVSRWETGRIAIPLDQLEKVAGELGTTPAALMQPEAVAEGSYGMRTLPLYALGHVAGSTDSEADLVDQIEVTERQGRSSDAGFIIHGTSMEPAFTNGDIVLIRRIPTAQEGQLVIALADGETTFKRWGGLVDDRGLLPLNPVHAPIIASDVKIVGVYRWLIRESPDGRLPGAR